MAVYSLIWSKKLHISLFVTAVFLNNVNFILGAPQVPLNIHSSRVNDHNSRNYNRPASNYHVYRETDNVDFDSSEFFGRTNFFSRGPQVNNKPLAPFTSNHQNVASVRITKKRLGSPSGTSSSQSYTVLPASREHDDHSQETFDSLNRRAHLGTNSGGLNGNRVLYNIDTDFGDDDNGVDDVSFEDIIDNVRRMSLGRRFHPQGVPIRSNQVNIPKSAPTPPGAVNANPFILPPRSVKSIEIESAEFGDEVDDFVVLSPMVELRNHETSDEILSLSDDFMNQYNFVDVQGTTKWGYKTDDQYQDHQLREDGTMEGKFGWSVPGGSNVNIQYIADENGYRVVSSSGIYPQDTDEVQREKNKHLQEIENVKAYHENLRNSMSSSNGNSFTNTGIPLPSNNGFSNTAQSTTGITPTRNEFIVIPDDDDILPTNNLNISPGAAISPTSHNNGFGSGGSSSNTGIPLPTIPSNIGQSGASEGNSVSNLNNNEYLVIPDDDDIYPINNLNLSPGVAFSPTSNNDGLGSGGSLSSTGIPLPTIPSNIGQSGASGNNPNRNNNEYLVIPDDDDIVAPTLSVNNFNNQNFGILNQGTGANNPVVSTGIPLPSNIGTFNQGSVDNKNIQHNNNYFVIPDDDSILPVQNQNNIPSIGIQNPSIVNVTPNPTIVAESTGIPLPSNIAVTNNFGVSGGATQNPNHFIVIPDDDDILPAQIPNNIPTIGSQNPGAMNKLPSPSIPVGSTGIPLPSNIALSSNSGASGGTTQNTDNYFVIPDDDSILPTQTSNNFPFLGGQSADTSSGSPSPTSSVVNTGIPLPSNNNLPGDSGYTNGITQTPTNSQNSGIPLPSFGNTDAPTALNTETNDNTGISNDGKVYSDFGLEDISPQTSNTDAGFGLPSLSSRNIPAVTESVLIDDSNNNQQDSAVSSTQDMLEIITSISTEIPPPNDLNNYESSSPQLDQTGVEADPSTPVGFSEPNEVAGADDIATISTIPDVLDNDNTDLGADSHIPNDTPLNSEAKSIDFSPKNDNLISQSDKTGIPLFINSVISAVDSEAPKIVKPSKISSIPTTSTSGSSVGIPLPGILNSKGARETTNSSNVQNTFIVIPVEDDTLFNEIASMGNISPDSVNSASPSIDNGNNANRETGSTGIDPCSNGKLHPSLLPSHCLQKKSNTTITEETEMVDSAITNANNFVSNNKNNITQTGVPLPMFGNTKSPKIETVPSVNGISATKETNLPGIDVEDQGTFDPCLNSKIHPTLLPIECQNVHNSIKKSSASKADEEAASVISVLSSLKNEENFGVPLPGSTFNSATAATVINSEVEEVNSLNNEQTGRQGKSLRRSTDRQDEENLNSFIVVVDTGLLI